MKYISTVALLLTTSSAVKLSQEWINGVSDTENNKIIDSHIEQQNKPKENEHHHQQIAQAYSRWVELPDCTTLSADDVPLKDDLSNAIIATCKSYNPNWTAPQPSPPGLTPEQQYQQTYGTDYKHWTPQPIYDPIFSTKKPLLDHEHQVIQHEEGHTEITDGSDGPHGDWYMHGKPTGGQEWPTPTYTTLVQIYHNSDDPEDIQVVQLKQVKNKKNKWVELADCRGDSGEVSLNQDLSNATVATCKKADVEYMHSPDLSDD